jgi:hypothetical protein
MELSTIVQILLENDDLSLLDQKALAANLRSKKFGSLFISFDSELSQVKIQVNGNYDGKRKEFIKLARAMKEKYRKEFQQIQSKGVTTILITEFEETMNASLFYNNSNNNVEA